MMLIMVKVLGTLIYFCHLSVVLKGCLIMPGDPATSYDRDAMAFNRINPIIKI